MWRYDQSTDQCNCDVRWINAERSFLEVVECSLRMQPTVGNQKPADNEKEINGNATEI